MNRKRRTFLGGAVGAILAMLFIPYRHGYGYKLIVNSLTNVGINAPQLVVNVLFATLVAALAANLSKRGAYIVAACLAFAGVGTGVFAFLKIRQGAPSRAARDEEYANELVKRWFSRGVWQSQPPENIARARTYLHNAADNWHLAGNKTEEERLRAKAKNPYGLFDKYADLIQAVKPTPTPFDPDAYLKAASPQPSPPPK